MYDERFYYKFRDTFVLAQAMIDRGSLEVSSTSLVGLCEYFEIPIKAHTALGDVLATLQLYKKLLEML
jgi:DNA polymerase III epsilon subunit-like protein